MGAAVPMKQLLGRRLSIGEQDAMLAALDQIVARCGKLTPREAEIQRTLRKVRYNRTYSADAYQPRPRKRRAKRLTMAAVVEELLALQDVERERGLTHDESERLGTLVLIEQRRARTRPARIAALRAELDLLESLEIASTGASAVPEPREIDLVRDGAGVWQSDQVAA